MNTPSTHPMPGMPGAALPGQTGAPDASGKQDEKSSQHGKNAKIVAGILVCLLLGGLLVDALLNPPKPPQAAKTESAPMKMVEGDPFADFEARQRAELAKLEAERRRNASRESMPNASVDANGAPVPMSAEQQLREAARLEDIKRALGALKSKDMMVEGPKRENSAAGGGLGMLGAALGAAPGSNASKAEATLVQLRQAIERAKSGSSDSSDDASSGGNAPLFARDLRGADASSAVVGQAASARRERGDRVQKGEFLVPVGTVMSAVLDMEINSDWEGRWRAMLSRDVYDVAQEYILLPKGTRILGTTTRAKAVNESINERMALAARWAVLPNGARIDLSRSGALDQSGVGAISGDVDRHFMATIGGVAAYGVIGGLGAAHAARSSERTISGSGVSIAGATAGAEVAKGLVDVGQRVASRYLNLVPTITIKPGTPMTIFLDDELYLLPWAPIDETLAPLPARSAHSLSERP